MRNSSYFLPKVFSFDLLAFAKQSILSAGFVFFISGCLTLGKDFPKEHVSEIKIGQTNKSQIRKLFGPPWLSGSQDGKLAWTYGNYDYSLFGERKAKDMVVQFDKNGLVTSYTFSTTEHSE